MSVLACAAGWLTSDETEMKKNPKILGSSSRLSCIAESMILVNFCPLVVVLLLVMGLLLLVVHLRPIFDKETLPKVSFKIPLYTQG